MAKIKETEPEAAVIQQPVAPEQAETVVDSAPAIAEPETVTNETPAATETPDDNQG